MTERSHYDIIHDPKYYGTIRSVVFRYVVREEKLLRRRWDSGIEETVVDIVLDVDSLIADLESLCVVKDVAPVEGDT